MDSDVFTAAVLPRCESLFEELSTSVLSFYLTGFYLRSSLGTPEELTFLVKVPSRFGMTGYPLLIGILTSRLDL